MPSPFTLSALLTIHGSDKNTDHAYGPYYDELANILLQRSKPLHILEFGVDKGSSIKALHAFFQDRAMIYGVDRNIGVIKSLGAQVKGIIADQSSESSLADLAARLRQDTPGLDLVIDDASHAKEDQLRTAEALYPLVAPGGYYVIEDLQHRESASLFVRFPGYRLIDLREVKNRCDDMLIVLHKPFRYPT